MTALMFYGKKKNHAINGSIRILGFNKICILIV